MNGTDRVAEHVEGAVALGQAQITELLRGYRFTFGREQELQELIARVLSGAGVRVEREAVLGPRCRIDLLADTGGARIGVEIKVAGAVEAVARQLQRYARTGRLDALVLATTRATHLHLPTLVGDRIGGLPVTVACLTHLA